jgi:hypothetical protein
MSIPTKRVSRRQFVTLSATVAVASPFINLGSYKLVEKEQQ